MFRFLTIIFLLAAISLPAQSMADKFTESGIGVFIGAYQDWDGNRFLQAAELFQKACEQSSATATNFYWQGVGEFHCALQKLGATNQLGDKSAAAKFLGRAGSALETSIKLDAGHAESHALLATIYGMRISENWLRALWLGPRVQHELELALDAGTNNARVIYLQGVSQFHTASRRSSYAEALATLLRAEKLFEAESGTVPAPLDPRWGFDGCLAFIGETYEKLGQSANAATYFQKALKVHPLNGLAKAGLHRVAPKKP